MPCVNTTSSSTRERQTCTPACWQSVLDVVFAAVTDADNATTSRCRSEVNNAKSERFQGPHPHLTGSVALNFILPSDAKVNTTAADETGIEHER